MEKLNRINNVIIFDGTNEYSSNEIFKDSKLTQIYNTAIALKGAANFSQQNKFREWIGLYLF
ncbi:hypothetical protein [Chryseobacterium mucoviscidosis]|uniref:hypothetical protein n=1 Tax=Chryseobacterium mucoviscidosis TaxID=1945581 RepID=UPI0031D1FCC3